MSENRQLRELGEDRIVSEVVLGHLGGLGTGTVVVGPGDDAAVLRLPLDKPDLVVTVDPCPTPVVDLLGAGTLYDWGRMAALISLSDLAATGAQPVGLLCSTTMQPEMLTDDYEQFLSGLSDLCEQFHTPIVGGNIRDGGRFEATTTALGCVELGTAFCRSTAEPGDQIVVVGQSGLFWSAVLSVLEGTHLTSSEPLWSALYRPTPKLSEALVAQSTGFVTAAIDCSDGLGGAVEAIAASSKLAAHIDFNEFPIHESVLQSADSFGCPAENLLLSWGDWQLVLTTSPADCTPLIKAIEESDGVAYRIGEMGVGSGLRCTTLGSPDEVALRYTLASKRFASDSYMTTGIDNYRRQLVSMRLAD